MDTTPKQRLELLLDGCDHIGRTSANDRRELSKNSLIQRLLEIQAQQLLIDDEYEQCLQSNNPDQLIPLDQENDELAEECDEIETMLYEKYHLIGGGRCLLTNEAIEAADLGDRMARSSKLELTGNIEGHSNVSSLASQSLINTGVPDQIVDQIVVNDSSSVQSNQPNDQLTPPVTPIVGSKSGRKRSKSSTTRKSTSKSQSAVITRLNEAADRIAARRQQAQTEDSLLSKLFQYFDDHIDIPSSMALAPVKRKQKQRLDTRSFPYVLGTIQFPLFSNDMRSDEMISQDPIAVQLDFDHSVYDGQRHCLIKSLQSAHAVGLVKVLGYLPFPLASVVSSEAVASVSELPHPLVAIQLLLEQNIIKVESAVISHSHTLDSHERLVEVTVFIHSKFVSSLVRSLQTRYALLSLFSLFPIVLHRRNVSVVSESQLTSHHIAMQESANEKPLVWDRIVSSRHRVLSSDDLTSHQANIGPSANSELQLETCAPSHCRFSVSTGNSDHDAHIVPRRIIPHLISHHTSSFEQSVPLTSNEISEICDNEDCESEANVGDDDLHSSCDSSDVDSEESGFANESDYDSHSVQCDDDVDLGLNQLEILPRYTFVPLYIGPVDDTDEKMNDDDEEDEEDDGLRVEEQYELSALVLSQATELSVNISKTLQPTRTHSMSRHDLHTLYELIRPFPLWSASADQPSGMVTPLLPFQRQGLAWMMDRESGLDNMVFDDPASVPIELHATPLWFDRLTGGVSANEPSGYSDFHGGILADAMGLGKTLSCIGLILSRPYQPISDNCVSLPVSPSNKPHIKGTLIVSPVSLIYQWHSELMKHAPSLRVLVYTTEMEVDLFPNASLMSLSSDMAQDSDDDYMPAKKKVKVKHRAPFALSEYDVVLTSYSTLAQEVNYSTEMSYNLRHAKIYHVPRSPLLDCFWHRVVLDEAQRVQNAVSVSGRMARRLQSSSRWAVSGTPIGRGGLADIYGLVAFCGIEPYASQQSAWDRLMDISTYEGMDRLVKLLRRIMWRHNKSHVRNQIALPSLTMHIHHLTFMPVEWEAYRKFEYDLKGAIMQAYDDECGTDQHLVTKSITNQIDALRQMCDHPQINSQSFLSNNGNLQTMSEISSRLLARAHDELGEAERGLCRQINSLGAMFQSIGHWDEAEEQFTFAWRIYDLGLSRASQTITQLLDDNEVRAQKVEIVTQNSQQRAWKVIELISIGRLKQINETRRQLVDVDDALDCKIKSFSRQLDAILDDILDALVVQENQYISVCDQINTHLLSMWINDAAPEIQDIASKRIADDSSIGTCLAKFHTSSSFSRVTQLNKQWKPMEVRARDICRQFEDHISQRMLDHVIHLRAANPGVCQSKRNVHQQLLNAYYPIDYESRLDAMLFRARSEVKRNLALRAKQFKDQVWEHVHRPGEFVSLNDVDWQNQAVRAQFEADWATGRASVASLECMIDCRKNCVRREECRSSITSAKQAILDQCARSLTSGSVAFLADAKSFCDAVIERATKHGSKSSSQHGDSDHEIHDVVVDDDPIDRVTVDVGMLESKQSKIALLKTAAMRKHHQMVYLQRKLEGLSSTSSSLNIDEACSICHVRVSHPVITSCGHLFCFECLQRWMLRNHRSRPLDSLPRSRKAWQNGKCPNCSRVLSAEEVVEMPCHNRSDATDDDEVLDDGDANSLTSTAARDSEPDDDAYTVTRVLHSSTSSHSAEMVVFPPLDQLSKLEYPSQNMYGTKVDCITRHLLFLSRHHPRVKSLVFSQFPRMLSLFAKVLDFLSISYVLLHGDDSHSAALIERFQNQASCTVMLMSLRRDSSGLTLVSASHIFLVEPSVDSSVESQAINRCHRIGQTNACQVHKFIMRNSIESKLEEQHDRYAGLTSNNDEMSSHATDVDSSERELAQGSRETGIKRDQLFDILDLQR